jgi:hypothetical protein
MLENPELSLVHGLYDKWIDANSRPSNILNALISEKWNIKISGPVQKGTTGWGNLQGAFVQDVQASLPQPMKMFTIHRI